jgi:hypothetical protein
MAFDGTWKVDRSENYDKFMEKMGKNFISCWLFLSFLTDTSPASEWLLVW